MILKPIEMMLHGAGIFTYIYPEKVNIPYMEHRGIEMIFRMILGFVDILWPRGGHDDNRVTFKVGRLKHVEATKKGQVVYTKCTFIVKGSLVGETSVLRTFRMSGKELVKERVSQRKR